MYYFAQDANVSCFVFLQAIKSKSVPLQYQLTEEQGSNEREDSMREIVYTKWLNISQLSCKGELSLHKTQWNIILFPK